ncbi:MAG: LysM peptidoglycan-binding domain-containing protein [Betaproteobacteria bacterium]|nr:LysM peptidoglycan-binding domain-containing protein [Betaproteobacteria bacterium]MDH5536107.1 LysM peptidoglycan-binding domain-containing protein [Betaproteobacteria bacterium]
MHDQLRKSITALIIVLGVLATGAAPAQIPQTPIAFKTDAPDRYVVVRGDTLWGISERFTDSPWRWPEIWNFNREQIRNPHWIFPGDVIVLDRVSGTLSIAGADGKPGAQRAPGDGTGGTAGRPGLDAGSAVGTVKLSPRLRAESTARDAIPSIPPSAIEPFLSRPLVIEPDGLDNAPTIIATEENRVIIEAGNQAYVRGMGDSKEENWFIYRRGKVLVDPDTDVTLGYEAIYLGTARVTRAGDPATVRLTTVTQEVGAGDKLLPVGVPEVPKYAPHAPAVFMQGRVMGIYGGLGKVGEAGPQQIITLNRGRADGVEVGHVFALYRPGPLIADASANTGGKPATFKLPDERYGLAFVFRIYDRVSYALVMRISRPVNPLDVVQTP